MLKSMKKDIIWNTSGSIFYCICQWLMTIMVVHLSSYEDAGYLSLAMTTSSSFSAISLFSMRNYQISDIKRQYSSDLYVGSRVVTCAIAVIFCIVCTWSQNTLEQELCILAFMLIRVAEAIVDVMHGIDQKYERYDIIGKSYFIRGGVTVFFFYVGLVITNDLTMTLILVALFNLLIAFAYDWIHTYKLEHFIPKMYDKKLIELLKVCLPLVLFTFMLSLENLIPKTVLEQCYGAEKLGIYSSMASPTLIVQVFASVAFNPFLPMITEAYYSGDKGRQRRIVHRVYVMLLGMSGVVTIGAMLLGKIGLYILFGHEILAYYDLFLPIVWCTILTAMIWVLSAILVAFRKIKWLLLGMIVDFIICVFITRPIILTWGSNGVSIVQIIVLLIYIIFMVVVCEHDIRSKKI